MSVEVIYYTLVATGLYFMSDWILDRIEVSRGERFKNRSVIFFLIILTLAFISFSLMKYLLLTSEVASQ
ncbi:MAG: hypothetical protein A3H31_01430 [Gallionellales bacterium RIFCSPLOWO2_02_FULL_57_47]|nr:MAG: hypothetical protein A3H31_01430 [Gallionellales bacterium RIFCSPLOWO2_02_FULL_57_47]OGT07657.1 MAG: hypothetical protein A3J49_19065 [Gallionellales bacterium RIFCSPHIGHO2_02_FULL_57_16]